MTSGRRAAHSSSVAAANSRASGAGRRMYSGGGSRNDSGQSKAIVCTSCGSARQTGPQEAGSVITCTARGSALRICSGRMMRSK